MSEQIVGADADGVSAVEVARGTAVSEEALATAVPLSQLDPHDHHGLVGADHKQNIELKKTYAKWLLILMAVQLGIADVVFVAYAWAGVNWDLETAVVQAWLGATMVELVGVALVITRYLFSDRDQRPSAEA